MVVDLAIPGDVTVGELSATLTVAITSADAGAGLVKYIPLTVMSSGGSLMLPSGGEILNADGEDASVTGSIPITNTGTEALTLYPSLFQALPASFQFPTDFDADAGIVLAVDASTNLQVVFDPTVQMGDVQAELYLNPAGNYCGALPTVHVYGEPNGTTDASADAADDGASDASTDGSMDGSMDGSTDAMTDGSTDALADTSFDADGAG
jgi:hypothetical protein